MATFMSIVKYEVDENTGAVRFISGFTKPYGDTTKKGAKPQKKLDTGDYEGGVVDL